MKYLLDQTKNYQILSQTDNKRAEDPSSDEEDAGSSYESDSSLDLYYSKETMANYGSYFTEELVATKKNKLLQKFLIYGFIALIAIAIIVVLSVFLTKPPSGSSAEPIVDDGPAITLEDVLEGRLYPQGFNGSWAGKEQIIFRDTSSNVVMHNIRTRETKILIPFDLEPYNQAVSYSLSPDEKYLLIAREYRKLFRSSFSAIYDILNIETKEIMPLLINGSQKHLLLAEWNPKTNGIIFNFGFDLYYKKSVDAPEIRITFDGKPTVYNGVPDWVYEEEVLSSNTAYWFSPDGNLLAFMKFDDTKVPFIDIPVYGPPGLLEFQYPNSRFVHYPKSGVKNPEVSLMIANLDDLTAERPVDLTKIAPPKEVTEDHIISTVAWADNTNLVSVWMNRIQNKAVLRKCQLDGCETIALMESNSGWIDLFTQPLFKGDGSSLAVLASQPQEGRAGAYRHLTMISTEKDGKQIALTKGKFIVTELLKWNSDTNLIFYTANLPNSSESKHLYAVKGEANAIPQCLTCSLTSRYTKKPQDYFDAEFNKDGNYFILSHKGPDVPEEHLYTYKQDETGKIELEKLMEIENNEQLVEILETKATPLTEIHEIPITGTDFTAKVLLQLPRNVDRSGKTKYPMLVDVYGGPDSFAVMKKFSLDWGSYMAANRSVIYARIDGRGSGLRGDLLLHEIYKKLGTVEVEDQISTARKLSQLLPFIDPKRVGIWGWSYGGFASGMALAKDKQNVFRCATSVAPVTDWLYYDSIYTERFMDIPKNNFEAYVKSRLSTMVEGFRNKQYMLVHGTLDDNVHFQQSMALARSLEKADILFKEVSYPDEDHGLGGVRPHLYHTLGKFFEDCFEMKS